LLLPASGFASLVVAGCWLGLILDEQGDFVEIAGFAYLPGGPTAELNARWLVGHRSGTSAAAGAAGPARRRSRQGLRPYRRGVGR
jgi:hypothetical protein